MYKICKCKIFQCKILRHVCNNLGIFGSTMEAILLILLIVRGLKQGNHAGFESI